MLVHIVFYIICKIFVNIPTDSYSYMLYTISQFHQSQINVTITGTL